jgi:P-type E1-E2 ATPase
LIVAIPEGLPLAVSLAMALSTEKLKNDNILIKNIESIQKLAMVHDICVSKTGCLTDADMVIAKYQICDNANTNDHIREAGYYDAFRTRLEISTELKDMIIESMIANTDVRLEIAERRVEDSEFNETEYVYEPCG